MASSISWGLTREANTSVVGACPVFAPTAQSATIVAFNAENLFDTADDPDNPGDDTYVPLEAKDRNRQQHDLKCEKFYGDAGFFVDECRTLNWSEEVYATKLERYGGVVKAMAPTPDVSLSRRRKTSLSSTTS